MREVNQTQARGQVRCMTFQEARESEAPTEDAFSNRAPVEEEGGRRRRRNATGRHAPPREREYDGEDDGEGGSGGEGTSDGRVRRRTSREEKYLEAYIPHHGEEPPTVRERRRSVVEMNRWRGRSEDANTRQRHDGGKELLPQAEETRNGVRVEMRYAPAGREGEVIGPRWGELVDPSRPWLRLLGWQPQPCWRKRPLPRGGVIKRGSTAITWNSVC